MSISGLIEQQVHARPDAIAVTWPTRAGGADEELTYRRLSRSANRLAAQLRARGVGRGDRVVTSLGAGPDLVTAFLAIVRAGAAYVPVDPSEPVGSRRLIVADSAAKAVVTLGAGAGEYRDAGARHAPVIVTLDDDAEAAEIAARSAELPENTAGPDDACYVCYTSGTTGTPKGVVVPHRAVLDFVGSYDCLRLTRDDVVAQTSGPAFDAVTFEVWTTLTSGARLAHLGEGAVADPERFERALRERDVSVAFLTTAVFNRIARERPAAFARLRAVLFGGEACDPRRVREVFAAGAPERLLHVYGPAEATTFATWHEVAEPAEGDRTIPVGRPLGTTTAVVVGPDGLPVAPGGTGELLLGGPGLAAGYLDRPELTAQRFVTDRFRDRFPDGLTDRSAAELGNGSTDRPGAGLTDRSGADGADGFTDRPGTGSGPLFRTGDLMLLREDGALEFAGRVEDQVRLGGFRIGLGEIESALTAHPAVSAAAVRVHEDADGERRLVAHVVPGAAAAPAADHVPALTPVPASVAGARTAVEERARITDWKEIHEALYNGAGPVRPGTGPAGWTSGYDALPLPAEQVDEWRRATVDRLRALPRRRVLEIGAGTGALLEQLAADEACEEYWATDFAPSAVAALTALTRADARLDGKVRLHCRAADDITGLPAAHFDTIVLNSVVQYFPSLAHLRAVIERTLPLLAPGGSLFLGDLRNLDLHRCFRTGVELARPGAATASRDELRRRIDDSVANETELLLSPALFTALADEIPEVRSVDVRARRGVHHNELTRYRYDAVLSTAAPVADLTSVPTVRWGHDVTSVATAEDRIGADHPAALRLTGVPNRRVHDEYTAAQSLDNPLESIHLAPQDAPAPDPEALCVAAERLGYLALPTWSGEGPELLDLVFVDPDLVPAGPLTGVYAPPTATVRPYPDTAAGPYANTPAAFDRTVALDVVLRAHLKQRLPEHMIPALVTVDALPLNTRGKVDRAALPAPAHTAERPGTQPGTPVQEIVRDLFAEALGLPRREVHADSDFFRQGGHSLAVARLLSRVRETLDTDPGCRALYEAPTPAGFAALLGDVPAAALGPAGCAAGSDSAVLPLRLRGTLDERALEQALEDLGHRHEALRNSRLGAAGTRLRRLSADDHVLDLALPAAAVDLWSHLPLAAELAHAYGLRVSGGAPHRAPGGLDAAPRAVFGDLEPTALPGGLPHTGDSAYGTLGAELSGELHARLTRFAAEHGSTVFMVVHAALAALLSRLGASSEVTVSAPVPARDSSGLRGAVGPFARVLALAVDTTGDPAFDELLHRVRESDLAAYRDSEAPLALPGGVALTVLQQSEDRFTAAGLTVHPEEPELPLPAADLALTLTERQTPAGEPAGVTVTASYRCDSVGEAAAAALTGQLTAVLEAGLRAPETALSRLRLLPGAVKGGVWEGENAVLPEADAAALFAAQVARTPEAPALAGMTYAELDARADLLAHALIDHQAGPGTSVLTALSSPTGFAVAALAVAKTGAALLPVDPSLDVAESLRPVVLLLDETADLLLPAVPGAARLVRDDAADRLPAAGHWPVTDRDRIRPLTAGAPVLLVPGEDGTVVVGAEAVAAATAAEPSDAAWLVQGYPDGDAALGLLGALASGARVHLPDGSLAQSVPHEVLRWLRQQGARTVIGGADDALTALVALARTENAPLSVSGGWAEGRLVVEQVPGGPARPAPGHRAYVLDARLCPVAPGETGSLYIAGAGVAHGYAGAPAATGERFLPDPFGGPGGATALMWRTGRAARLDADGNLRVLDHPAPDDPFADEFATFVVLADATDHHALWPATAPAPDGWYETHPEDLYELCLAHINDQLNEPF